MNDLDWSRIAEWLSILGLGFMVVFRLGKFSKDQENEKEKLKEEIVRINRLILPDDPDNDIIRQHDLNQFEKLLKAYEERLKLLIQFEIGKIIQRQKNN